MKKRNEVQKHPPRKASGCVQSGLEHANRPPPPTLSDLPSLGGAFLRVGLDARLCRPEVLGEIARRVAKTLQHVDQLPKVFRGHTRLRKHSFV